MKNLFPIFLIISILCTAITYVALDNIFMALGVFLVFITISMLVFIPMLKKYDQTSKRFHECYHFINNFIIALSIKKTIGGALESTVSSMPDDFVDIYEGLENMTNDEKLSYFSTYFQFYVYRLFLQIIALWQEEGGDILLMSKYLINEARNNEEYMSKCEGLAKHKYVEIAMLWFFTLIIVAVLRFSLKDFYQINNTQIIFVVSVFVLMGFILLTIYLLIQKGTSINLKGANNEKEL